MPPARQLAAGLLVGLPIAVGLSRGFAAAVDQLSPPDMTMLFWIAAAVSLTTVVTLVGPARRALRLQVMAALRVD